MAVHLRHQPHMDLRTAAKADAFKDTDTYSFDSQNSESGSEFHYGGESQVKPASLHLATSTPVLQNRYQSDEEQVSPTTEGSNNTQEDYFDSEDSLDFDDVQVISAFEIASQVRIVYAGKPKMTTISALAPMHKRQGSGSRPTKMVHASSANVVPRAIPRRSSLRDKVANRSVSMYEPPVRTNHLAAPIMTPPPHVNFSGHIRSFSPRPSPLSSNTPPQLVEPSSPTSSYADSEAESLDEADALMKESEDIQFRTHSMERERASAISEDDEGGILGKPPTPTSYDAYDPFALSPPTLNTNKTSTTTEEPKKWKGLGLGRKVRLGRNRGRQGSIEY